MRFSKFLNAHPSGHKARGYAFLSLSNTGFDFRTTPLLFNFKIKKIFFALLSFFILFTISWVMKIKQKTKYTKETYLIMRAIGLIAIRKKKYLL